MERSHTNELWQAAEPEEIWEFTATKVRSLAEMEEVIDKALIEKVKGTQFPFTVIRKSDGKTIGSTRFLDISEEHKSLEIGWTWYHPEFWRTSVNTECKLLLLEYAFERLSFNRVQFKTDSRNIRSQNAITRLGALKEGTLRQDRTLSDGYTRDTVVFSILASEWPSIKKVLLKKLSEG